MDEIDNKFELMQTFEIGQLSRITRVHQRIDAAANHWPEPLRGDHHNIDVFSRNDRSIIDRKAVGKEKGLALSEIRSNLLFVNGRHLCIRQREKNHVPPAHRFSRLENFEAISSRTSARSTSAVKANNDLDPAIAQVECMSASLCAKADHGAGLSF